MNRTRLLTLIEIAILAAMSFILGMVEFFSLPQGGGVSLVMVPIVILAFRRGLIAGLAGGLIVGLLSLFVGHLYFPLQIILDYPLPFALIGLSSIFILKNKKKSFTWYVLGILFAGTLKYLCHVLSGAIFFGEYAPEGWNPWIYSFAYNSFVLPESILAIIVAAIFYYKASHIFQPKN